MGVNARLPRRAPRSPEETQKGVHNGTPSRPTIGRLSRRGQLQVTDPTKAEQPHGHPDLTHSHLTLLALLSCPFHGVTPTRNLPNGPIGTVGKSQNNTPALPPPSIMESKKLALRGRANRAWRSAARRVGGGRRQGGSELRATDALAAFHLLELRHQHAAGLGNVGGHHLRLHLKAQGRGRSALAVSRDAAGS